MSKKKLNINHIAQLDENDCFVACAKIVIDYLREKNGEASLPEYASFLEELKTRGPIKDSFSCVTELINQYVEAESYVSVDMSSSHMFHQDVKKSLDADYPLIVEVSKESGSSHAVVIFEYSDENPKEKADTFKILDPLCTKKEMETDEKSPYLDGLKISYDEFDARLVSGSFRISSLSCRK